MVSRDVQQCFAKLRRRIAGLLRVELFLLPHKASTYRLCQDYKGKLNFALDAWTSLNHVPYIAITVHFLWKGKPISLLLDILKVAEVSLTFVFGPSLIPP
jgi:hypothetical protein